MGDQPTILILGAGPAGLGAARQLALGEKAQITVLEQNDFVGGNASSFDIAGVRVDFGSHRLHPACDPEILQDIRSMLGADLLKRPRHGRILLRNRWIHFPLKPLDLVSKLHPQFTLGVLGDIGKKFTSINGANEDRETFASVMVKGLGKTICQEFLFEFMRGHGLCSLNTFLSQQSLAHLSITTDDHIIEIDFAPFDIIQGCLGVIGKFP